MGDSKLRKIIRQAYYAYLQLDSKQRADYRVPEKLLCFYSYFIRKLQKRNPFQQDRRGADAALVATLNSLTAAGVLLRLPPQQAASQFGSTQALYCVGEGWG